MGDRWERGSSGWRLATPRDGERDGNHLQLEVKLEELPE
jgi:hypothetical protein